jgi:tRNA A37 methylthiotransferase MiaB
MIGSVQKVLVENKAKKGDNLFGRTENMRNTHFKGDESLIENNLINKCHCVRKILLIFTWETNNKI